MANCVPSSVYSYFADRFSIISMHPENFLSRGRDGGLWWPAVVMLEDYYLKSSLFVTYALSTTCLLNIRV